MIMETAGEMPRMVSTGLLPPVNRVKPAINFIRVQHETWPTPKRRVDLVASVYICQEDRWLTIRDNGNITGHWRSKSHLHYNLKKITLILYVFQDA